MTDDDPPSPLLGLRLTVIGEQAVIPFSSQENAVDCLRIVTEALRREQERE